MQAYDFFHLYSEYGCRLQVGGSDQYGNILAGVDYIRRRTGRDHGAAALTFPLVQSSTGEKLGKTAAGALWLDPERTSPYEWRQYWLNVSDADAVRYLKSFTFLELDEIKEIESEFLKQPKERLAQHRLAREMTSLIHGPEEAEKAERASAALFGAGASQARISTDGAPIFTIPRPAPRSRLRQSGPNLPQGTLGLLTESPWEDDPASVYDLVEALILTRLAMSNSEAKRLIGQGAVTLNGVRADTDKRSIVRADVDVNGSCLIAAGPRRRAVIRFSD